MAMKLVPISLEEYEALRLAGAWVWRDLDWSYCYTRVEE